MRPRPKKSNEGENDGIPEREDVGKSAAGEVDRGRTADRPSDLPAKGWRDILVRTKEQVNTDNLSIIAAGVGFYSFVAVVPALVVVIAIFALVANTASLAHHLDTLARIVPREVMPLLQDQLTRIVKNNTGAGLSATIGLLVAIYSSSNATKAVIAGLNVAYDEQEKRGFLKLNAWALLLTLGAMVGGMIALALLAGLPIAIQTLGPNVAWLGWIRWPLLIGLFILGVSILYRFGPSRRAAKWRWISWGATLAAILWVAGSAIFSYYVTTFGSYEKTYGSLGAVVVFLLWLYLSAFVVLIGAELNAEMERQTTKDTTEGNPKPLGERDAFAADTVGEAHPSDKR